MNENLLKQAILEKFSTKYKTGRVVEHVSFMSYDGHTWVVVNKNPLDCVFRSANYRTKRIIDGKFVVEINDFAHTHKLVEGV